MEKIPNQGKYCKQMVKSILALILSRILQYLQCVITHEYGYINTSALEAVINSKNAEYTLASRQFSLEFLDPDMAITRFSRCSTMDLKSNYAIALNLIILFTVIDRLHSINPDLNLCPFADNP